MSRRLVFRGFTLVILCGVLGCPGPASQEDGGGSKGDGGSDSCVGLSATSLDTVFPAHFGAGAPTTCLTAGCHASGSGGLTFSSATTFFDATVGKPSKSDPSRLLIAPGSLDQSQLYQRLLPTAVSRMPQGGPYLDGAALAQVAGWICGGARSPTPLPVVAPVLGSFAPTSGYVGTHVIVSGTGFSSVLSSNQLSFNGVGATLTLASPTTLETDVPMGATTGTLQVTVGGKSATSSSSFTVLAGNPVPVVSALTPCGRIAGSGAFTLTINGANFLSAATVTFKGATVPVTFVSASQLTASISAALIASAPAGNVAPVVVSNPGPGGGPARVADFGVASSPSSLSANVQPIFTSSCAKAGCHTSAAMSGGLDLASGHAYGSLVDAPSAGCPGTMRVIACAPRRTRSVLVDKLLATPGSPPCSGTAMPKGAPLTASEKQKIIDWIAQGAPQ